MIRTFLIALAVLGTAPLAAQDAMPPRFFIEKIEVRDAERVSPDVVIAESRLHDGHEYTEADLRDASARLMRLPYLLSAEFSLEKGSERGRYVLVVTINETKAFFYALDFRPILKSDDHVEPDYSDRLTVGDNAATLGMRWFMGRRGALHIALVTTDYNDEVARNYAAFAVGYTQYDLFGTRAFATLSIKQVITDGEAVPSPQLVVGMPVTANQTLTLDIDETRLADDTREIFGESFDTQRGQRVVGLTWSYNTTNRPFIPTRGTLLTVRPRFAWSDTATYRIVYVPEPPAGGVFGAQRDTLHAEAREIAFNAARYWELTDRSSVSTGVESSWTHFRIDSALQGVHSDHIARAILAAGYSYSLWDAERTKSGDSRLELNVRVGNRSIAFYDFYRTDQRQVSASWVRRSSWGVLRLGAGYAW